MSAARVCFVSNIYPSANDPSTGTFVENSYLGLKRLGRDVRVVALDRSSSLPMAYLRFYWRAWRTLRRFDGIAYVHYVSHSVLPVLAVKRINDRLRLALHFHGGDAFPAMHEGHWRRKVKKLVSASAIRHAELVIVPSSHFADRLCDEFGISRQKVHSNASAGVDETIFHRARHQPRNGRHVLFVSRMIPGKGAMTAARILKQLFDQRVEFTATLVGAGPERDSAEALLSQEVADNRVRFLDPVPQRELAIRYQEADIFIFASTLGESLGLSLLEAIFCGALPIAFDTPAARWILGGAHSEHLLAADNQDLQRKLDILLHMSSDERRVMNAEILSENRRFESRRVSQALSKILT